MIFKLTVGSPTVWIVDFILFTFKNRVSPMCQEASVVRHLSLPLMNNFNKTEAAISPGYTSIGLSLFSVKLVQGHADIRCN